MPFNINNFELSGSMIQDTGISGNIVTDGLVLHLDAGYKHSYPMGGTTWYDLSGNGNNGTLTNGPTFNSNGGGSIDFDGTNDYVTIPSSNNFAFGTGNFTIEVWLYAESFSGYVHMVNLPTQTTFTLKANITDGDIYFYSPSFTTYGSTSGWTLQLNAWNHVVFKRENSVAYAFLNSVAKGSKSGFTTSFSAQSMGIHSGYNGGEFTPCLISTVRVYNNRALSLTEIQQNYNATKGRFGL